MDTFHANQNVTRTGKDEKSIALEKVQDDFMSRIPITNSWSAVSSQPTSIRCPDAGALALPLPYSSIGSILIWEGKGS